MNNTTIDYADFAEYDRRQRAIECHLITAFLGGLAVGLIGMLISGNAPAWLGQIYDPYAYLALSLTVGATASGFGWALLTTFLAAVSTLVAAMGAGALRGDDAFDVIGGSAAGLNWTLALLVGLGLLAYTTRRDDGWGDVAAGAVGAALIADVVDRATPGFIDSEQSFWPGPAVVVGLAAVALVLGLRRNARARVRALAVSAVFSGVFTVCLAAFVAGWIPLAV
ncbi:unnamed protein product [[Actinomadura] parvosata subsp. kistnae]|uniref:Uncharacterized protein n=1 Tax=[Actinomadura] parvosata subsp. kistnae TaxID=1909395 RepID=A0A1V0A6M5_9ACTN|nr:hypothetical protein [Nonomuraea sp. ATCC 55076]AQZ65840.1 hypothetical protein BKM31_34170 [Nonomuraea sp. ATCC 55076]SPL97271.1 unnamed protein product [Actinomadura parvosata subsp. kistnae]